MTDNVIEFKPTDVIEFGPLPDWAEIAKERGADAELLAWLQIRRDEAKLINPATAEMYWHWTYVMDPYGVLNLDPEERCIGRSYFARRPGSDIWVEFSDLSGAQVDVLQQRIDRGDFLDSCPGRCRGNDRGPVKEGMKLPGRD